MPSSRIDSLAAPDGAKRVPFLVIFAVLAMVVVILGIGFAGWHWIVVLLVPVVIFTLYVLLNVLRVMAAERGRRG